MWQKKRENQPDNIQGNSSKKGDHPIKMPWGRNMLIFIWGETRRAVLPEHKEQGRRVTVGSMSCRILEAVVRSSAFFVHYIGWD